MGIFKSLFGKGKNIQRKASDDKSQINLNIGNEEDKISDKKCAICGETILGTVISCPKCGGGVFENEKKQHSPIKHSTQLNNRYSESGQSTANNYKCPQCGAILKPANPVLEKYFSDVMKSGGSVSIRKITCVYCGATFNASLQ